MTISEILPVVPRKSAERYARLLAQAALISPVSLGDGRAFDYSDSDASTIAKFVRHIRDEGLSVEKAFQLMGQDHTGSDRSAPDHRNRSEPAQAGVNRRAPVQFTDDNIVLLEAERKARHDAEAAAMESAMKREEAERQAADAAKRADEEEKRRREAEIALDLDRRNMLARIARLEKAMNEKPKGMRARIRAAWDVLAGRRAAPLALPVPRSREKVEPLEQKAA